MSNVKIKKAKIKDDLFLDVEYTEELEGHSKKDTKLSCTIPIHEDLKTSFDKLHRHLAVLCNQVKEPKKGDFSDSSFPDFSVHGISIGGNDENQGVTINGWREGKFGGFNLSTPFTKFEDTEYPFIADLGADIESVVYEVEQYLFEGKRAPEKQLEMDFGGEADELPESKETTTE